MSLIRFVKPCVFLTDAKNQHKVSLENHVQSMKNYAIPQDTGQIYEGGILPASNRMARAEMQQATIIVREAIEDRIVDLAAEIRDVLVENIIAKHPALLDSSLSNDQKVTIAKAALSRPVSVLQRVRWVFTDILSRAGVSKDDFQQIVGLPAVRRMEAQALDIEGSFDAFASVILETARKSMEDVFHRKIA